MFQNVDRCLRVMRRDGRDAVVQLVRLRNRFSARKFSDGSGWSARSMIHEFSTVQGPLGSRFVDFLIHTHFGSCYVALDVGSQERDNSVICLRHTREGAMLYHKKRWPGPTSM